MNKDQAMSRLAHLRILLQRALIGDEWEVLLSDEWEDDEDLTTFLNVRVPSGATVLWWLEVQCHGEDEYDEQVRVSCTGDNTPAIAVPLFGEEMLSPSDARDLTWAALLADDAYNVRQWEDSGAPAGLIGLSRQPGMYTVFGQAGWAYEDVVALLTVAKARKGLVL